MKLTRIIALAGVLIFGALATHSTMAQFSHDSEWTHTISIENGNVYIDGDKIPQDELPESLNIEHVTARFSFVEEDEAYLDLGGRVYHLSKGRLVEMDRDTDDREDVAVFFATGENGTPIRFRKVDGKNGQFMIRSSGDQTYEFFGEALFDQVKKLEELRGRISTQDNPEMEGVLMKLSSEAEHTARMAEALPQVQFQSYMRSIENDDSQLYAQLRREQTLELRTREMAARIRSARSQEEKERMTSELREDLETIFSLKQQNRKHEIEQLTQRLSELESRLKERQELRERIIKARMNELLGRRDW